jgi:hypothetical protein
MRSIRPSLMVYCHLGQAIDLVLIPGMIREANLRAELAARS